MHILLFLSLAIQGLFGTIHYSKQTTMFLTIHVLEFNPQEFAPHPVLGLDTALGRESVLSMAKRNNAIAAINGGCFLQGTTFDGLPIGALKINQWISLSDKARGAIGWDPNSGLTLFDILEVQAAVSFNGQSCPLDGLNQKRAANQAVVFNGHFGRTTLTDMQGEEIWIRDGIVHEVRTEAGSHKITDDYLILSIGNKHHLYNRIHEGDPIELTVYVNPQLHPQNRTLWEKIPYVVSGAPLLVDNSMRIAQYKRENIHSQFFYGKYARTAIGVLKNGNWVFVVVEQKGFMDGMNLLDLELFMHNLGCQYALNLCGGDVPSMVCEGQWKSAPYPEYTQRVSNGLIVVPRG